MTMLSMALPIHMLMSAANNDVDLGYNEAAAKQSWENMLEFMKANLA